jgi:hypothetical protein
VPFAWHTLESMHAPVLECDTGADDQVLHGASTSPGFAVAAIRLPICTANPLHLAVLDLAFTTVKSSPDIDP